MNKPNVWRMVGKDLDVLAAAAGDKETTFKTDVNNGDIVGLSVAENYDRADLASILLTIEVEGMKPLYNVPLSQLLPDNEEKMWIMPVPIPRGSSLKCNLTIRNANTAVDNPIVLVCHHAKP